MQTTNAYDTQSNYSSSETVKLIFQIHFFLSFEIFLYQIFFLF